jgi:hypothetical protein
VFSNGIIVLAVLSCTLLAVVGANVNRLVPFYAIGVFTAFTMAGFGMAKFHHRVREPHWRRKLVINFSAGLISMIVVLIFVVVKFTEGAWLVVILFAAGVPVLIWLNRQYILEATVLETIGDRRKKAKEPPEPVTYARRTVFVFVDDFDLATIAALRYARSLRPTTLQAVHFVVDNVQADRLRQDWIRANTGISLEFVDCPDRRIAAAAGAMVNAEATLPGVGVTAILPRRSYAPVVGRLLHDRTADKMAGVISRIPYAVATIVPFDVRSRVESLAARQADGARRAAGTVVASTAGPAADQAPAETGTGAAAAAVSPPRDKPTGEKPGRPRPASAKPVPTRPVPMKPLGDGKPADGKPARAGAAEPATQPGTGTGAVPAGASGPSPGDGQAGTADGAAPGPDQGGAAADAGAAATGDGAGTARPDSPMRESAGAEAAEAAGEPELLASDGSDYDRPVPPEGVSPIGTLTRPARAVVQGRVHAVEIRPVEHSTVLACDVADSTGELTALFYGRSNIPGLRPGSKVRLRGQVGIRDGRPVMINPAYELLAHGDSSGRPEGGRSRQRRGSRKPPDDQST